MGLFTKVINPTGRTHSASVIFFHGSGDSGTNLVEWIRFLLGKNMEFPHIKLIYPTAPLQPYTPMGGEISNVWFDRRSINIEAQECRNSLSHIYETVHELINEEIKQGIPANRIIIGGFSMGGALAMHTAFHLNTDIAGVFVCSGFLNRESIVYDSLRNRKHRDMLLPELRIFHGDRDNLVPIKWGKETFDELASFGINGNFTTVKNTLHELKKSELVDIEKWILSKLALTSNDIQNKL